MVPGGRREDYLLTHMKIIIIGPSLLTRNCLQAILREGGYKISALFCLKDKYADEKARFAVFDDLAEKYNFDLHKIDNINSEKNIKIIKDIGPDLIIQLGWSQIISEEIINIPKKGCIGIHGSMLPKGRGGASFNWALIKDEKNCGTTLFYMDRGLDKGKIIAQKEIKIEERDTVKTLQEKEDAVAGDLLIKYLPLIRDGKIKLFEQNEENATYLPTRKPIQGFIFWGKKTREIHNLIRALTDPYPGAFIYFNNEKLIIWESEEIGSTGNWPKNYLPGTIIKILEQRGIVVKTGDSAPLLIKKMGFSDGAPMWADDFAGKYGLKEGDKLGDGYKFLRDAEKWLINSGIQNYNADNDFFGGFNAWYDLKNKQYSYIYSEITGYGITALLYFNSINKNIDFVARARAAADWLLKNALLDCGAVLTRKYLQPELNNPVYSFDSKIVYAFDTGMVLFGMANLYKATGDEKYKAAAKKIGDFLLTMQKPDGFFWPVYSAKTGEFSDTDNKWSTQSGSFHSKLALGLLALRDIIDDEKYNNAVIRICDEALKFQQSNGRFASFRDTGATHMHPHCYSCEGLFYAGKKLKDVRYVAAAMKGVIWSLENHLSDGGMPCIYNESSGFNNNQRSDTLAQVLRLAIYFLNDGAKIIEEKHKSDVYNLASKLISFQKTEGEQTGGFYYGCAEDGKKMDHINSWCSMFGVQALSNLERHCAGYKLDPDYLV